MQASKQTNNQNCNLQSDKSLETVVKCHPMHVMETYGDDWVEKTRVIFEEDKLDVNQQYPLERKSMKISREQHVNNRVLNRAK